MATIPIPGALLGYDDTGSGPAVVLVHAGLADRRMWDQQVAGLALSHRVIRYDWRGYGGSSDLSGEVAHHEDLLAMMDALDVTSATLVGASMGGCYALDAALAQPARVDALVLVSAVYSGFAWPARSLAQLEKSAREAVPAERLTRYAKRELEPDPADVAAMAAANVALMVAAAASTTSSRPYGTVLRSCAATSTPASGPAPRGLSGTCSHRRPAGCTRSPCQRWSSTGCATSTGCRRQPARWPPASPVPAGWTSRRQGTWRRSSVRLRPALPSRSC